MWECPKCKESMHDYDTCCWNCKTRNPGIPEDEVPSPKAPKEERDGTPEAVHVKKCPYCAEEILAEAVKCRYCGSVMPAAQPKTSPQEQAVSQDTAQVKAREEIRIPKKAALIILICIAVIAAVWAVTVFVKPVSDFISSKTGPAKGPSDRNVAYEEIVEYDGKGGVKKSVKTYPQAKSKDSPAPGPGP